MKTDGTLDETFMVRRPKPVSYLLLALVPLFLSFALGVVTSYVNFNVSPAYFQIAVWGEYADYIFVTLMGGFEGIVYGCIFSFTFTIYVAWKNHRRLGNKYFRFVFTRVTIIVLICWLIGGVVGVVIFRQFPGFGPSFDIVLTYGETYTRSRFGWVGGSIGGGTIGGVGALAWAIYNTSRQRA